MSVCSFSIKFLVPVNISLQGICMTIPPFCLTVLPVKTAVEVYHSHPSPYDQPLNRSLSVYSVFIQSVFCFPKLICISLYL